MEDLTIQHDGTVRDANSNIVQFHYGEDGINPTKIETQGLPLGKLSEEEIQTEYGLQQVDWSTVLTDGTIRENDQEALTAYMNQVLKDREMLVEGVFQRKTVDSGGIFAPVNLARWILNIKTRFGLTPATKTDLTPLRVLKGIDTIIARTHSYHKIWAALLRFYLAPHKLIVKERFTVDAFEMLMEMIVVTHMKSWVQPGDQIGIVAAQSIGEPATQMSSVYGTKIRIVGENGFDYYGPIGKWLDELLETNKEAVQTIGNDSVVMPMAENYYIVGVSNDEKTSWKRISEISRHPANGGVVEVVTRSGRRTTATLSHSFLKRSERGIVPVLGSDLVLGMRIPVARQIPEAPDATIAMIQDDIRFDLTYDFGWLCGIYLADGNITCNTVVITKVSPIVEQRIRAFIQPFKWKFTTRHYQGEYGPSKGNIIHSKTLCNFLLDQFKTGSYEKVIPSFVFSSSTEFIRGLVSGFFDGDGNASASPGHMAIRASSRNKDLIDGMASLLGYAGLFGSLHEEKSISYPDQIQYTLQVPLKFAKEFQERIAFHLPEKVFAIQQIIDYNARDNGHNVQEFIDKIPELGRVIADMGKRLSMPGQSRTYGRWAKKESIGVRTLEKYIAEFEEKIATDGIRDPIVQQNLAILKSAVNADVFWDEIVELNRKEDPKEFVYDFTVPGNDSFMVDNNILVHNTLNTFHQAGVASKSAVTRGVPRLRELLKVTKKPKATSLTIYLKPEYCHNKDKAREVVQEMELTKLRNITDKVSVYWDEKDLSTVVDDDRELMAFYGQFEQELIQGKDETVWSKWVLRLELNREEMFNRNISIQDIVMVMKSQFAEDINIVYSDYNSDKLVMRIRIPSGKAEKDTASRVDDFTNLKKFQTKLLNSIVIRGFLGIKAVTFRKEKNYYELKNGRYEQDEQYVLDTDGSNFMDVMNHPAVDGNRLYSTNVWDVYEVLGIEATRAILFNEINGLFEGVGINYRHLCLLCDVMTRSGRLMSIDRYGINKNDIGTLAKASFEETGKIMLKAALFGEVDPVTGVSANIMMGQPIRGGTAFSQILLDDQMLPQLLKDIDVDKNKSVLEEEKAGDLNRLGGMDMVAEDPCSSTRFQTNMILPAGKALMEEPEIEMEIVDE